MLYLYLMIMILALLCSWLILWQVPFIRKAPLKSKEKMMPKSFSIIIPARNEAGNLPILLASLQKQTLQPLEILVVDDGSEDETAAVAAGYGAHVIPLLPDENKWIGKSAACWTGALAAKGDWILFLDADVFLPKATSLANIIYTFQAKGSQGIISIQPYHVIHERYENFSVVFNILVLAGMNQFSFLKDRLQPAGAFGPSLLCCRNEYFHIGGHARVKDSLMENIDLGKYFLEEELPVSLYAGKGSLHFRMYADGLAALSQGWSKSFASGSNATHPLILLGIIVWITGALAAFFFLFYALLQWNGLYFLIAFIGYSLYFLSFFRMAETAGDFHWQALLVYPLLFFYFIVLFSWSAVKTFLFRAVTWKDREIKM